MTAFASSAAGDPRDRIVALYEWYARVEAPERSLLFAQFCDAVAQDSRIVELLVEMPTEKWQPNLLVAAVRFLHDTPEVPEAFVDLIHSDWSRIADVMATRSTQTNEPARCATLLPVLARLPQPLALLEVGAAAGLCLQPDRYAYDFNGHQVSPNASTLAPAPVFACHVDHATPLPERDVDVAWRGGLDLHPIDVRDDTECRWLEALVWPGQAVRLEGLRAAIEIARFDPPTVTAGDLRADLPALVRDIPSTATLVIFHTAVLAYLPEETDREAFAQTVEELGAHWIANERPPLHPRRVRRPDAREPEPHRFSALPQPTTDCLDRSARRVDDLGGERVVSGA